MSDLKEKRRPEKLSDIPPGVANTVDYDKYLDFLREKERKSKSKQKNWLQRLLARRREAKQQSLEREQQLKMNNSETFLAQDIAKPLIDKLTELKRQIKITNEYNRSAPREFARKLNSYFFTSSGDYGYDEKQKQSLEDKGINLPTSSEFLLLPVVVRESPMFARLIDNFINGKYGDDFHRVATKLNVTTEVLTERIKTKVATLCVAEYVDIRDLLFKKFGTHILEQ